MVGTSLATAFGLSLAVVAGERVGDPRPTYRVVDRVFAMDPEFFASFWARGFTEHLRIAMFGDSQETSPGGKGYAYLPNINRLLHEFYGHSGETILMSHRSVGGGTPPAGWLWRGGVAAPNGSASILEDDQLPPNITAKSHRQKSPQTQTYGMLAMLLYDGSLTGDPELPEQTYFTIRNPIAVEILAITAPGSGGISYKVMPNVSNVGNYFAAPTGSGVLDPGLDSNEVEVVSVSTPQIDLAGLPYAQVEVWGSSLTLPTQILGVRYVDLADRRGATVQSLAAGGYRTRSFRLNHERSGPIVRGMGFDLAMIHTSCNDAAGGISAEEYREDLIALIAWIREAADDPSMPVIVVGDVHRVGFPDEIQQEYDRFPAAALELAQNDPRVMAINLRRITEEDLGWGDSDTSYLDDVVHLSTDGQRVLARVLVESLTKWFTERGHVADVNGSGFVDASDLAAILGGWGRSRSPLDLNEDGVVDAADLGIVIAAWGWQSGSKP